MNSTIKNFLIALKQIEEIDFSIEKVKLIDDDINIFNDRFSTYENNFVTKLNEKYAVLNTLNIIEEPRILSRQLQIPKKWVYSDQADEDVINSINKLKDLSDDISDLIKELTLIPDFIIHKNQANSAMVNQLLIAEVKTEHDLNYKKFAWDFLKLIIYLNKFNFQNAIFLGVNVSENKIKQYIDHYIESKLYLPTSYRKLQIIIKEDYKTEVKFFSLQDYFDGRFRRY